MYDLKLLVDILPERITLVFIVSFDLCLIFYVFAVRS